VTRSAALKGLGFQPSPKWRKFCGSFSRAPLALRYRDLLEITLVFGCILAAIWTPLGPLNSGFVILAMLCVLAFAICGRWSASQMGLTRPLTGAGKIILIGGVSCMIIVLIGVPLRHAGPGYRVPWPQAAGYAFWALQQEFILQAIFFLRFEALLSSRRAVFASASVYAVAHLPSPILAALSLFGGMLFCELFRRWRNLYPIGLIHAALGLTIAASMPDKWMHHMRVGIGYLTARP
jgi:CAAX prenyl protease-like protein